jgi:hypothetical protein
MEMSYLRWRLRREWPLALLLPFLGLAFWMSSTLGDPPGGTIPEGAIPVPAVIASVTPGVNKRGPNLLVSARSKDGQETSTVVAIHEVAGCKAGDTIKAWCKGVNLYISPAPCPVKKH